MGKITPWGELPDNVYVAPAIAFEDWVTRFRGKIKPGTTLYYTMDEMVAESGAPKALIYEYVKYSESENYDWVMAGNRPLTDAELIEHWKQDHPVIAPADLAGKELLKLTAGQLLAAIDELLVKRLTE